MKSPNMKSLFARWQAGEQISTLAAEAGLKRSKLRKELTKLAGGKDKFKAMRAEGAGGHAEPFGGKRREGGSTYTAPDDTLVSRVPHARKADGWSWHGTEPMIIVSPDGREFIRAKDHEAADLIITHEEEKMYISPSRMKLYGSSKEARKAKKEAKLIEQGEKARKAKRAAKKAAKPKRVKRKI